MVPTMDRNMNMWLDHTLLVIDNLRLLVIIPMDSYMNNHQLMWQHPNLRFVELHNKLEIVDLMMMDRMHNYIHL